MLTAADLLKSHNKTANNNAEGWSLLKKLKQSKQGEQKQKDKKEEGSKKQNAANSYLKAKSIKRLTKSKNIIAIS